MPQKLHGLIIYAILIIWLRERVELPEKLDQPGKQKKRHLLITLNNTQPDYLEKTKRNSYQR